MSALFNDQPECQPERKEQVNFKLKFDKEILGQYKNEVELIMNGTVPDIGPRDTLTLKFDLNLEYFNCIDKIKTIIFLMEKEVPTEVSATEINYGRCLIQDLLLQISEIQKLIGKSQR
jgi:hypothetical protein